MSEGTGLLDAVDFRVVFYNTSIYMYTLPGVGDGDLPQIDIEQALVFVKTSAGSRTFLHLCGGWKPRREEGRQGQRAKKNMKVQDERERGFAGCREGGKEDVILACMILLRRIWGNFLSLGSLRLRLYSTTWVRDEPQHGTEESRGQLRQQPVVFRKQSLEVG